MKEKAEKSIKDHFSKQPVPFVKTCDHCNSPLKQGIPFKVLCFSTSGFNKSDDEEFEYWCEEHQPKLRQKGLFEGRKSLKATYIAIAVVLLNEGSPDSKPKQRDIEIKYCEIDKPPQYDI